MLKKSRLALVVGVGALLIGGSIMTAHASSNASTGNTLPPEKQAMEDLYKADAQKVPMAAKPAVAPKMQAVAPEQWPSGILTKFAVPFRGDDVTIQNVWQKDLNGVHVQVYAGALADDPTQGIVIVRTTSADMSQSVNERFLTSTKAGALKISAENNLLLSLKSNNGQAFTFDVTGKSFK